ncbi:hypothetical protein PVT71_15770 [Salipiger sp. H15]|uniref:Uncharacterized protein n=1 Tax=Alloyangia sp. H15 TaxID=3029062 RepID=A0AAU8APX1_9RHOB
MVEGSATCGELPNSKWSWAVSYDTVTIGGDTSTSTYDELRTAGRNQFLDTYTVTTIEPTYEQVNITCTALNPQGKINLDHSTTILGEMTMIDPGSSSEEKTSQVKVCGPNLEPCS